MTVETATVLDDTILRTDPVSAIMAMSGCSASRVPTTGP